MKAEIKHRSDSRLVIGGALILIGALLAIGEAGYLQFLDLNRTWPLFVIALAFVRLYATMNAPRQRGWALLLLGDWLFANTMTDWAYAAVTWPILLTGIGALMIFRAISHRQAGEDREESEDRVEIAANHYVL
jgi:hypothetical protein